MRIAINRIITLVIFSIVFVSCGDKWKHTEAEMLLEKARKCYAEKQYDKALSAIDSLRREYSSEIELRKTALELYKDIELEKAEKAIQKVDAELKKAEKAYTLIMQDVDKKRKDGSIGYDELLAKTKAKARLDSLRIAFDTECAKIRYIKIKKDDEKQQ